MQLDPHKYRSTFQTLKILVRQDGFLSLTNGFAPTLIGYSLQGMFKYGLNDVFKDFYKDNLFKNVDIENNQKNRMLFYALSSGSAEIFADIALCPHEMTKVKIQLTKKDEFPKNSIDAYKKMFLNRNNYNWPFGSLIPLWTRQVPYTIVKFVGFEKVNEIIYNNILKKPKSEFSSKTQLGVTFISGYIAGIFSAIVSQPADNLVSQLSKNQTKSFSIILKEQGINNLLFKGLGVRIFMLGSLTGMQWYIFNLTKTIFDVKI